MQQNVPLELLLNVQLNAWYYRDNQTSNLDEPSYPDTRKSSEKSEKNKKKKFTRHTHLDISLLKPRGEEINVFTQIQIWGQNLV